MSNDDPPLLDTAQLASLADDVGSALPSILETFRDEMRDLLLAMRKLHQAGAMQAVADKAHTIKGTAAAMGLAKLSAAANRLEQDAAAMSPDQVANQVAAIQALYHRSCMRLVELGHLSSPVSDRN